MNCTSVFDQFSRAIVYKSKGFTLNPVLYLFEQVGQIVTLYCECLDYTFPWCFPCVE